MLKVPRKPFSIAVLLLCIALGGSLAAYCYIWVTSNEVHVDMQYAVVLSNSVLDSNVTLNAEVTNTGSPVRAGIAVDFYCSHSGGPWTYFATQVTDASGVAQATYTALYVGGYDFKAVVNIP